MPTTINGVDVKSALSQARASPPRNRLTSPPEDWRDCWIYFLMVDRFNNPSAAPVIAFDGKFGGFQGGTIEGMRQNLDYLKDLGVGAVWFTPVLKNCQFLNREPKEGTYHGYGIQNHVRYHSRVLSRSGAGTREVETDWGTGSNGIRLTHRAVPRLCEVAVDFYR